LDEVYNHGFTTWLHETCKFGWMNMIGTLGLEAYFNFGWMNLKLWLDEFLTLVG
jgi:hypothetical protein